MMSKMKNRKTAVRAAENELPEPGENECIVRVLGMRSGNMVEVFNAGGDASASYLCRVPSKFNKMIWIKRGAFENGVHVRVFVDSKCNSQNSLLTSLLQTASL